MSKTMTTKHDRNLYTLSDISSIIENKTFQVNNKTNNQDVQNTRQPKSQTPRSYALIIRILAEF